MSVVVTSKSDIKLNAVRDFFSENRLITSPSDVVGVNCDGANLPPQPIINTSSEFPNGYTFAKERINYLKRHNNTAPTQTIVSIENCIDESRLCDVCYVVVVFNGMLLTGNYSIKLPQLHDYVDYERSQRLIVKSKRIKGYNVTYGEHLHTIDYSIDPKNWMEKLTDVSRHTQIIKALQSAFSTLEYQRSLKDKISSEMKTYSNFPKEGVMFVDMFPIFADFIIFEDLVRYLKNHYALDEFDYIVGLEARGFVIGSALASYMRKGFIPIRKSGKLPGPVFTVSYGKEYGTDVCEIQKDAIPQGSRVLIVDDIIATGGSMQAAVQLVEMCGGTVVDCCVLKDVPELRVKCLETLKAPYSVHLL